MAESPRPVATPVTPGATSTCRSYLYRSDGRYCISIGGQGKSNWPWFLKLKKSRRKDCTSIKTRPLCKYTIEPEKWKESDRPTGGGWRRLQRISSSSAIASAARHPKARSRLRNHKASLAFASASLNQISCLLAAPFCLVIVASLARLNDFNGVEIRIDESQLGHRQFNVWRP